MKKVCSILLAAALALFWGACGSDDNGDVVGGSGGGVMPGGGGESGTVMPNGGTSGSGGSAGQIEPPAGAGGTAAGTGGVVEGTGGVVEGTGGVVEGTGGVVEGTGGVVEGTGGAVATGDPEFDACIASLQPVCVVSEIDSEAKMEEERGCASLEFIPIPLSGGGQHGPVTIPAGPYGGKILWNEGAGSGFENNINPLEPVCLPFGVETFNEPASVNAEILNTRGLKYELYTIFTPACMKEGEKYPVITWANGTCGLTHGYTGLLGQEASYGFVIVASNSTWTMATTAPDGVTPVQLHALDYAEYLNNDPNSVFYQRLDMEHIGAAGHSQGSGATSGAASDPRIDAIILWNGGASNVKPFIYVSADRDVGGAASPASLASATNGASQPGAWVYHHQVLQTGGGSTGHLVLMEQPERVWEMSVAWWQWQLKGDQDAKNMFIGDNCGLCNRDAEFEYGHNSHLQ